MKNIKFFTLLTCLILWQAALFTANAQCNDISISNVSTNPASCMMAGSITVTIAGSNLDLTKAQYRLMSSGDALIRDWSDFIPSNTSPTKTITDVGSGSYIVRVRTFCTITNNYTTAYGEATATVGGNYTSLQA